ncbi:unnamed protein product [marine sediment metagenome]|uniref:Uncharacterized protein n=1 Tax=marine sediment metagenome TaxID=412755 RepID=X1DJN5_9ZZZZ
MGTAESEVEYLKSLWVKRPIFGYALDLTKGHVHIFDGQDFYIIEKAEKGGITIRKDKGE